MKKFFLITILLIITINLYTQESLKSIEEEYYDFLSLTGVVERPTLGYRTLSDSVWNFNEVESFEENEDGTFTKVRTPGEENSGHIWKNNNLGTTYTLWQPEQQANNWFARGVKQGFFARVYGPEWFNSYNTDYPYGQNDGALWQGTGYNTSLTTGLRIEGYGFELTVKPQISWSQNKVFKINDDYYPDPHSFSFHSGTVNHNIDIVQRYGDSSFWNFDLGDTEARWNWNTLTFGFGTQNPWLGPAYLNPMLGSNNAGGYLKFDAGLRKTEVKIPFTDLSLGSIEGRIWIGQLQQSDYFNYARTDEDRMLTAMSASYNPSFIPGFTIGLNRVFVTYWRPENFKYILRLFTASRSNALSSSGNDEDQKFALFAEWDFPKVGFVIYGEFGRDDFSSNEKTNPFHTAIYTVGAKQAIPLHFTKVFPKLPNFLDLESELNFEWNNFEMSQDFQLQWSYLGFYAHGFVNQGLTHKGQVLGASSCWAGNSQLLQYKVYHQKGYISFMLHRYCPNINSIYSQAVNTASDAEQGDHYRKWYGTYKTFYCYGLKSLFFINNNYIIDLSYTYIKNYEKGSDPSMNFSLLCKYEF
ncbi:hypothetical protein SAMN04487775_102191 [Treponema bryantii]|uniref:Capsule assembly protein Wzi n=1 Tax=Treponema bryantii TaxID=163 RepID=A0A1I3IXB3_9SPIR|nr:hypothetical protein [Treponema bryantii]SFI52505.1 hypothetical protein SAMN04487775_102191 [Treponema bryantii]